MSKKRPRIESLTIDEIFSQPSRDRSRAKITRIADMTSAIPGRSERLCIRGIARMSPSLDEIAQLLAKVGLVASEVSHSPWKDVSFVTVSPAELISPESKAGDPGAIAEELQNLIQKATRILQGSKWKGATIDAIEFCKSENYATRLKRTWLCEEKEAAPEVTSRTTKETVPLQRMPDGEILRIKAPYGMGYVWVSTKANIVWESETGRLQDQVFSSRRKVFHESDDDSEDSSDGYTVSQKRGEEGIIESEEQSQQEIYTDGGSYPLLSDTSSDEDEDEDEDEDKDQAKNEAQKDDVYRRENYAGTVNASKVIEIVAANRPEAMNSHDSSVISGKTATLAPMSDMLGGIKGSSVAKPYTEEEWDESNDSLSDSYDGDENQDYFLDGGRGMNLLARLKGGGSTGKKKRKSSNTKNKGSTKMPNSSAAAAISLAYAEETWDNVEDELLSGVGKRKKRRKKEKKKPKREDKKEQGVLINGNSGIPIEKNTIDEKGEGSGTTLAQPSSTNSEKAKSEVSRNSKKPKAIDRAKLQNQKRLQALSRRQREQERVKAMVTASLSAPPKAKKITFSSSDEDEDDEDQSNQNDAMENRSESSKIVMFSSDDEEDSNGESGKNSKSGKIGNLGSATGPCPTSDEARFKLKEDYAGEAGGELIRLQRRIGNDSRFRMDKSFLDSSDDEHDDKEGVSTNDDNKEFEKFDVMDKLIPEVLTKEEVSSVNNTDLSAEVDNALDALRSVLEADGGAQVAQQVRDAKPSHSHKAKQGKGRGESTHNSNKVTYNKYDPEAEAIKGQLRTDENGKEREKKGGKNEMTSRNSQNTTKESISGIFGVEDDSSAKVDPSKRFYESKTGFWTSLYNSTKDRKDVVVQKASSAVFRLTDLGLDENFALTDLGDSESANTSKAGANISSIWSGVTEGKDTKQHAGDEPSSQKPSEVIEVGGFRGFLTEDMENTFMPFVRVGSAEDAHAWWIEHRRELTDEFRRKHRDALKGKRNR